MTHLSVLSDHATVCIRRLGLPGNLISMGPSDAQSQSEDDLGLSGLSKHTEIRVHNTEVLSA